MKFARVPSKYGMAIRQFYPNQIKESNLTRRVYFSHSSNVDWAQYDDVNWELFVGYKGGNSYRAYLYKHVPAKVWHGLVNASSPGTYIWEVIRHPNAYQYELETADYDVTDERIVPPAAKESWWSRWLPRSLRGG